MRSILNFFISGLVVVFSGSVKYYLWLGLLLTLMLFGAYGYSIQFKEGLVATGMHDHVSWGIYISNFIFFVGVAAGGVMLVIPAYIMKDKDFSKVVLIGEGLAVAALVMALMFVLADLGGVMRFWHMLPGIGYFHFPESMLTWDVLVLNGYLALNLAIPAYILYCRYNGREPVKKIYVPFVILSVFWAFGIHLVTAFLLVSVAANSFWSSAILGPRFLASAFTAGPALIIVIFSIIRQASAYKISDDTINKLAMVMMFAAYANLVMLFSEIFKEFYWNSEHTAHARYLFFGLDGHHAVTPFIWSSVVSNVLATLLISFRRLRENHAVLVPACLVLFGAIWVEKGLGLVIPGFIPSQLGEIVEYLPTFVEIFVTLGIIGFGLFTLTALLKVFIWVETGAISSKGGFAEQMDAAIKKKDQT
ncbi:MAG: NrfD/PsrC family molybdoenzyme membrane anchor subunit [Pontiella sp.]